MSEPVKQEAPKGLSLIESNKKQIVGIVQTDSFKRQLAAALMARLPEDYVIRSAIATINASPKIQECTPLSIAASILLLAQAGLAPEPWKGHGYLVPRSTKIKEAGKPDRWEMRCTALIGYRGYLNLAYGSSEVTKAIAHPVYEGDIFDFDQVEGTVTHKPWIRPEKDRPTRGKILGAYALVKLKNGEPLAEWMPLEDIEATRARSKASDDGPWKTDYSEMARKTPFRRLFKWIPDPGLQKIAALEEASDFGNMQVTLDAQTGEIVTQVTEIAEQAAPQPIQMPKRQEPVQLQAPPQQVPTEASPTDTVFVENASIDTGVGVIAIDSPPADPPASPFEGDNLFDAKPAEEVSSAKSKAKPGTIGKGKAERIKAIIGSKKTRSKQEYADLKKAFKIDHLEDLPVERYPDVEKWAAGE